MKKTFFLMSVATLVLVLALAACRDQNRNAAPRQRQITAVMEDSIMMHMMMDSIATDGDMRVRMMYGMIVHTQGDTAAMRKICKVIMDNKGMHELMMSMMRDDLERQGMKGTMPPDKLKHESEHRHP